MHVHGCIQVSDTLMSIATLTGEPLEKMDSKDTAPKIIATMVGKGADFANKDASMEGIPAMPQVTSPITTTTLSKPPCSRRVAAGWQQEGRWRLSCL